MRQITLVTRPGCHLCDDARLILTDLQSERSFELVELSVDTDPELHAKFTDHVPVVLLDGAVIAYWTVARSQILAVLDNPAAPVSVPLL